MHSLHIRRDDDSCLTAVPPILSAKTTHLTITESPDRIGVTQSWSSISFLSDPSTKPGPFSGTFPGCTRLIIAFSCGTGQNPYHNRIFSLISLAYTIETHFVKLCFLRMPWFSDNKSQSQDCRQSILPDRQMLPHKYYSPDKC